MQAPAEEVRRQQARWSCPHTPTSPISAGVWHDALWDRVLRIGPTLKMYSRSGVLERCDADQRACPAASSIEVCCSPQVNSVPSQPSTRLRDGEQPGVGEEEVVLASRAR